MAKVSHDNPRSKYDAKARALAREIFEDAKEHGYFDRKHERVSKDLVDERIDPRDILLAEVGEIKIHGRSVKVLNIIKRNDGMDGIFISGTHGIPWEYDRRHGRWKKLKAEEEEISLVYTRPAVLKKSISLEDIHRGTVEVLRHEVQHALQGIRYTEEEWREGQVRYHSGTLSSFKKSYLSPREIGAYAAGIYASSKKTRVPFHDSLDKFRSALIETHPRIDRKIIDRFIIKVHDRAIELYPGILKKRAEPKKRVKREQKRKARAAMAKRNPAKPFRDRPHDWDEVLISRPGKKLTRKQIRDYYVRNEKKIWPFLKGQTVSIIFAPKRNSFVRRRNGPDGTHIKLTKLKGIDDPRSYEYWVNRRVIEFHPVLTSKTTPILWLDLDMHKTSRKDARRKLLAKMRRAVPKLKKAFREMGVTKVHVYTSGTQGGIHLSGNLPSRRDVNTTRRKFRAVLDEAFADDKVFTTGPEKSGQIRLDTTTFHYLGSLRAPYSMTVHGDAKKPIGKP